MASIGCILTLAGSIVLHHFSFLEATLGNQSIEQHLENHYNAGKMVPKLSFPSGGYLYLRGDNLPTPPDTLQRVWHRPHPRASPPFPSQVLVVKHAAGHSSANPSKKTHTRWEATSPCNFHQLSVFLSDVLIFFQSVLLAPQVAIFKLETPKKRIPKRQCNQIHRGIL